MRHNRTMSFTIGCPECDEELDVVVSPGTPLVMYYPDGSGYPGDPPEIEELTGCSHVDILIEDDTFYQRVVQEAAEREQDAMEAYYEAKAEVQADRYEEETHGT